MFPFIWEFRARRKSADACFCVDGRYKSEKTMQGLALKADDWYKSEKITQLRRALPCSVIAGAAPCSAALIARTTERYKNSS